MGKFYFGENNAPFGTGEIGTLTLDDNFMDNIRNVNIPLSVSDEITFECDVDRSVLSRVIGGMDLAHREDVTSYTLVGRYPRRVQARCHKKKRVNKKWAKRYGYKTVYEDVRITDVHFNHGRDESGISDWEWSGRIMR